MSLKKKYLLNTGIVSFSKVIENLVSFLIIILISRELGSVGLGQYSFVFSFVGLFFIFSDFGLNAMMIKDLSKDFSKANKYMSNILTAKTILAISCFIFYFISLFFIGKFDLFWYFFLAGLIQLMTIIYSIGLNILRIKSKGVIIASIDIIERIIAVVGAFFVFYFTQSLFLFILVLFFSNLIRMILIYSFSMKYFKLSFGFDYKFIFSLIKLGFPFVLIGTFSLIYSRIDTVMLGFMKTSEVVGWYNAGYKLIDVLAIVPSLFLTFGFPMLSKFFKKNKKHAKDLFEYMIYYALIIVLPVSIGIYYVGDRILEFVYEFGSPESFIAFQILGFSLIFIYLSSIMGYLIASADKQKVFAWISCIGALINLILNLFLIPRYSLYGAAFTTLFTYFVIYLIMHIYIYKNLFKFKFRIFHPLIASIIMYFVLINILNLNLFWIVGISGVVYGLIIVGFNWKELMGVVWRG